MGRWSRQYHLRPDLSYLFRYRRDFRPAEHLRHLYVRGAVPADGRFQPGGSAEPGWIPLSCARDDRHRRSHRDRHFHYRIRRKGASGAWSLYQSNRATETGNLGQLGSWCLNFTMQSGAHPTQTVLSGPATAIAASGNATLTATVAVTDTSGLTPQCRHGAMMDFVAQRAAMRKAKKQC